MRPAALYPEQRSPRATLPLPKSVIEFGHRMHLHPQ
jgi:hypothetical protein